jgi:uncharacterized protein (TIGR04255 family)
MQRLLVPCVYNNMQALDQVRDRTEASKIVMPFPDSPRVIYDINPLEEVICQLKFPPILKIDSEPPAAFQDDIRSTYPLLQEVPGVLVDVPSEIAKMLPGFVGGKSYSFESADGMWKVALSKDFLALSTKAYRKWEDFRLRLGVVLDSLERHFRPAFYVRVGLRYRDVIRPSLLGIENVRWKELLQPWILGALFEDALAPHIQHTIGDVLVSLGDATGQVRIRHGLVKQPAAGGEVVYSIDSDFHKEGNTEKRNVIELLNAFNKDAGNLFRWCISDTLRRRLGPQPVAAAQ